MALLSITLFGDFEARLGPGPPLKLRTRKSQALLAYLALPAGRSSSRDKLATLLWGDQPPPQARARLRETVFALRKAVTHAGRGWIEIAGDSLALSSDAVYVDVIEFERLLDEGTPKALEQAMTLYRGDFLHGLTGQATDFEDWLGAERERLRELAIETLSKLLAHKRNASHPEGALQFALRLAALEPLQESVHRTLMRLYGQLRRRGAALRQYQTCVTVLRRELGTEPEGETRQLYRDLLRQRPPEEAFAESFQRSRARPESTLPSLDLPGRDTPLIGRTRELARLREALTMAAGGRGHVVMVLGEAGIGKTSLLGVLAKDALRQGMRVLVGRGHESDQILPFGPWVSAFRGGQVVQDAELLGALNPAWRAEPSRLLPELGTTDLPAPSVSDLNLFESVAQLVEQLAALQPLVLVLEDLHWADEMSLRLLTFISRRIAAWRALLLATAREEELGDAPAAGRSVRELCRESQTVNVPLAPLSRAETLRLVKSLARFGTDAAAITRLEEQVWAVSEGNPFVATETTRAVQEGTVPQDSPMPLPRRVQELIAARLGRLSDRGRHLAAVAAVIGREFDFALLHRAARLDDAGAAEGVEELVRRGALHGTGERFEFTHARICAVVYAQLLPPRRRLLHRQIGEALEALYADNLEPHHFALGMHYRKAELWEEAFTSFRRAGAAAMARSACREAVVCFEQALAIERHLPETDERSEQEIDLRRQLGASLFTLGELDKVLGYLLDAERLARTLGDQRRIGWVSVQLSLCYWVKGVELTQARRFGETALAIGEALADACLIVAASVYLGSICHYLSELRQAEDFFQMGLRALSQNPSREPIELTEFPAVTLRARLAQILAMRGEFQEGITHGQEALRIAEELDHPNSLIQACHSLGFLYRTKGDLSRAAYLYERGLEVATKRNVTFWSPRLSFQLGYVYALSGRVPEALSLLRSANSSFESIYHQPPPDGIIYLGEACGLAGQFDEARALAERGLALARNLGRPVSNEALSLCLLAEIARRGDPSDIAESEAWYRQALGIAEELGTRPVAARCHLGLGRLYRKAGRQQEARKELGAAAEEFTSMKMTFWLDQTEAELRAL